jgi:hypothetical protein
VAAAGQRKARTLISQSVADDAAVAANHDDAGLGAGREAVGRTHRHDEIPTLTTQADLWTSECDGRKKIVVGVGEIAGDRAVTTDEDDLEVEAHDEQDLVVRRDFRAAEGDGGAG